MILTYNREMRARGVAVLGLVSLALIAGASILFGRTVGDEQADQGELTGIAMSSWEFDGYVPLPEVPEPSGLCFHPGRNTLFMVDDGDIGHPAGIYELDLHATVLASAQLGVDLEGVCYCAADGMLYVCDEQEERVYIVDPDGLGLQGQFQVSRHLHGREVLLPAGNGFEGIEYIPAGERGEGDCLILLNQDDPHALVRVDYADIVDRAEGVSVPLKEIWPLAEINTGELHYDAAAGQLWVIHSWMNVMEVLDIRTMDVVSWEVFPGAAQEAVTVDAQGRLWVGYDLGGIARYVRREE